MRKNDNSPTLDENVHFSVRDVTGTMTVEVGMRRDLPAGAVMSNVTRGLSLSSTTAYALRDEESSVYLDDTLPIGDQISARAILTATPKTHLG